MTSWFSKIKKTLSGWRSWDSFLEWLNNAWISPNNLVTFRIGLMVSWMVAYILQKDLGAVMMTTSCILDSTDGQLARNFNKKSKEGEIYDPASDKITEMLLSATSLSTLSSTQSLVQIPWIIARIYFHYQSQFNEKRWDFTTQMSVFKDLILNGDKNVDYIENLTWWAANSAWKWKTWLQFTSGLGIIWLHTELWQLVIDLLLKSGISLSQTEANNFLTWLFIGTWLISIIPAYSSIKWRKESKVQEELNEEEMLNNPWFFWSILLSVGTILTMIWYREQVLHFLKNY
jgi:phosphatidylglycerophosphate synthase